MDIQKHFFSFHLLRSVFIILLPLVLSMPVKAYHFPWDQGHDVTDWNDPGDPGPCEGANCDPCASTRSPVYLLTGHFIWSETDIVLRGKPEIRLTRTYNSHDPRDGMFGNGWTVGCETGLFLNQTPEGNQYVLRWPDGKRYIYKQAGDGSYTPPAGRYDHIEPQLNGSVHLVSQYGGRREFTPDGKLISIIDSNGNAINYTYDTDTGLLLNIADANGRYLRFDYNSGGRVSMVTDHGGRSWDYGYDLDGNLTTVTDPLDGVRHFSYGQYDPLGDGHTYQQLTRVIDPAGVTVTEVVYNGERVQSYTEKENRYTYTYNSSLRSVIKTDSTNSRWNFYYNDEGLIIREIDPLGYEVTSEFDENGNLIQVIDELGGIWQNTYDDFGRQLTHTNPNNETITREFVGSNPKPVRITSPSGRTEQIVYDAKFNFNRIIDSSGNFTELEWDNDGHLVAVIDAQGNRSMIGYNSSGFVETITDSLGRSNRYTYNNYGQIAHITGPEGDTRIYTYDLLNRLISTTNEIGNVISYTYDAAGKITNLIDSRGSIYNFHYDNYGRLMEEIQPDGSGTIYRYRMDNQISTVIRPDNSVITYVYDAAGKITQENVNGEIIIFGYDPRGLLVLANNGNGTIVRMHDDVGRLVSETYDGWVINHQYNNNGERTRLITLNEDIEYVWDINGNNTQINTDTISYNLTYNGLGLLRQQVGPDGRATNFVYDSAGQLVVIDNTALNIQFNYLYDANGRIVELSGDGQDWIYEYDHVGRIINSEHGSDVYSYIYDESGNQMISGAVYDSLNRRTEDDNYNYSYDLLGNLTQRISKLNGELMRYKYNGRNRLVHVERYIDNDANEPYLQVNYYYDPLGRRIRKSVNGISTMFRWDGDRLVGEYDAAGNITKSYLYSEYRNAPVLVEDTNGIYQVHLDHLDTPKYLTDSNNRIVWTATYHPYGQAEINEDPDGDGINVVFNIRFPNQYYDSETGYHFNYFRYYNPVVGRYIQIDPIGLAGGINGYSYASNNPISNIDLLGLDITLTTGNKNASWLQFGNRLLHQEICVDTWITWTNEPMKTARKCFSFAATGLGFSGINCKWLGQNSCQLGGPLKGTVYDTPDQGISNTKVIRTTQEQDEQFLEILEGLNKKTGTYSLGRHSCRTFSQMMFEQANTMYGQ